MAKLLLRRMWSLRLSNFPVPELDHIRFVCMVDDARARRELDFSPRVPIEDTVRSVVADQW
jgi:UDP-glucose 4-epimerase